LPQSLAADTFHEIAIPPNLFDESGRLTIDFENRNDSALVFPLEDGLEVLYREGGFGLNFIRGLGIIFCWLALLAAMGLAAASFLSFPVAVFFAFSLLLFGTSAGALLKDLGEGTFLGENHETGAGLSFIDQEKSNVYKMLVKVTDTYSSFSPIEPLSTGRSIAWLHLGNAFLLVVVFLGGSMVLVGVICFTSRELATAQGSA
jgi:hypothetical protein